MLHNMNYDTWWLCDCILNGINTSCTTPYSMMELQGFLRS